MKSGVCSQPARYKGGEIFQIARRFGFWDFKSPAWRVNLNAQTRERPQTPKSKNAKKLPHNSLPELKLCEYGPDGGKSTLAHLFAYFTENRKTPKTASYKPPRAQTPWIRTRRGEIDPCASFTLYHPKSKNAKSKIFWQNLIFRLKLVFLSKTGFLPKLDLYTRTMRNHGETSEIK